jgi:hypothetical protein
VTQPTRYVERPHAIGPHVAERLWLDPPVDHLEPQEPEAIAALPPEKRDELRFAGLGPGDAYIVMWRVLNTYRREPNGRETRLTKWLPVAAQVGIVI